MKNLLVPGSGRLVGREHNYIIGGSRDRMRRVNRAIKLGVAIPQTFLDATIDPARLRAFLTRAETLGFASAWVVEQILGRIPSLEPVTALTYAAAVTTRMRLGSAVLLTALRSPVHLAKSLSSLDHLSGGRLDVGVGLGGNPRIYPAFGLTAERRAARFAESVRVMKRLWTEPRVTFQGEFWRLDNASMEPKPVQRPHPPIWFGAHHPNALRRTIELGDAFMGAGSLGTAPFAEEVKLLRRMLEDAGRDPASFPVGKRVYIAVDRDRARASKRLAEWFGAFYGRPEMAEQVSVWGDTQACVDGLGDVIAAGARVLLLNPVFDDAEHLERFAADLGPKLTA
jgi:probable F420-dependent oxidoreductase